MIKLDFGAYDDVPQEDSQMENLQSDDLGESFENEQNEMQDEAEVDYEQLPDSIAQNDMNEPDQSLLQGATPNISQQPNEAINNSGMLDFDQPMVDQHNINTVQIETDPIKQDKPLNIQLGGDETQQNINQENQNRITITNY